MTATEAAQLSSASHGLLKQVREHPRVAGFDKRGAVHMAPHSVYRVVAPAGEPIVQYVVAKDLLTSLAAAGLVETEIRHLAAAPSEGPSILEHQRITFVTVPAEWSLTMLLDAARLVCSLNLALAEFGLMVCDANALNITFSGGRPVFLDFGSLVFNDAATQLSWFEKFRRQFLVPLWFAGLGRKELVRLMLRTEPRGLSQYVATTRLGRFLPIGYGTIQRTWRRQGWQASLRALLARVDRIRLPAAPGEGGKAGRAGADDLRKADSILEWFKRRPPQTVHQLGGSTGRLGEAIAARLGAPVCSSDTMEASIEQAHGRTKALGLPLDVALLDVMYPTSPNGPGASRLNAVERLKADAVVALSLIGRLVLQGIINMETYAQIVSDYGARSAIVEFADPAQSGEIVPATGNGTVPPDYSLEGFVSAFRQHYSAGEVLSQSGEGPRVYAFTR